MQKGSPVAFGISEFTLVFRRTLRAQPGMSAQQVEWVPVHSSRNARGAARRTLTAEPETNGDVDGAISRVFFVPLCSTLALDDTAYEWFLCESGVLDDACDMLASLSLDNAEHAEIVRKQIQSMVMAAEVQHIVESMPA